MRAELTPLSHDNGKLKSLLGHTVFGIKFYFPWSNLYLGKILQLIVKRNKDALNVIGNK